MLITYYTSKLINKSSHHLAQNMPNEGNVVALEVLEKEIVKLKEFFSFQVNYYYYYLINNF